MSKPRPATLSSHASYIPLRDEPATWRAFEDASCLEFSPSQRAAIKLAVDRYAASYALLTDAGDRAGLVAEQKKQGDLSLITFNNQLRAVLATWDNLQASEAGFRVLNEFCNSYAHDIDLHSAFEELRTATFLLPGLLQELRREVGARDQDSNAALQTMRYSLVGALADIFADAGGNVTATGGGISQKGPSPFVAFVKAMHDHVPIAGVATSGTDDAWSDSLNKLLAPWRQARKHHGKGR